MTNLQQSALTSEVLQSVNEHFKRPRPSEDRFDTFGKNVANVLRDVLTPQRILAEKFISDVLFHAQMGTLTSSHELTKVPQLLLPQHQVPPASIQSASSNPPYFSSNSQYYNPIQMPQSQQTTEPHFTQSPRQPYQPSAPLLYQQLNQTTTSSAPTQISPLPDSDDGITVSNFVRSYNPDG